MSAPKGPKAPQKRAGDTVSEPKGRGAAWTEERGTRNERRGTREGGAFRRPGGERGDTV
jgi:hypothetical protein